MSEGSREVSPQADPNQGFRDLLARMELELDLDISTGNLPGALDPTDCLNELLLEFIFRESQLFPYDLRKKAEELLYKMETRSK